MNSGSLGQLKRLHRPRGSSSPAQRLVTVLLRRKAAGFARLGRLLPGFNTSWADAIAVNREPCDPGQFLPNAPLSIKPAGADAASAPIVQSLVVRGADNKQGAHPATDDQEWDCHLHVSILGCAPGALLGLLGGGSLFLRHFSFLTGSILCSSCNECGGRTIPAQAQA
jgi:hypothetical protein